MTLILDWIAGSKVAMIALLITLALMTTVAGTQTVRLAWEKTSHADDKTHWAEQVAAAERQGRLDTEAARTEDNRRFTEQERNTNAAIKERDTARDDAVRSAAAGSELRQRVDQLTRLNRTAAANTATAGLRKATDTTADLLANVQRRLDEASDQLAQYADDARIAGTTCERDYNSLTGSNRVVDAGS